MRRYCECQVDPYWWQLASRHGAPWILSMKLSVFIYLSEERDFKHYGLLCNAMLMVNPTGYLLVPWFVVEFTAICLEHSSCPIYEHYLSCQNRVRSWCIDPDIVQGFNSCWSDSRWVSTRAHIEIMACRPPDTYRREGMAVVAAPYGSLTATELRAERLQ